MTSTISIPLNVVCLIIPRPFPLMQTCCIATQIVSKLNCVVVNHVYGSFVSNIHMN